MKRAQLQAMETILISIVLILVLLFGIYFFSQINNAALESEQREFRIDEARSTALQLAALPELSCPLEGGEARICIDKIKLDLVEQALGNTSNSLYSDSTRLRYVELFGNTRITVQTHYPVASSVLLFNATSANNVITQTIPVNIYDAQTNSLSLGTIRVELE